MKVVVESINKIQVEGKEEIKNLESPTGTSDARLTNRTWDMEEKTSVVKDIKEEMNSSVKENVKSKISSTKYPENLGHNERT